MARVDAERLLTPVFSQKHVAAMLRHFEGATEDFQRGEWEDSIAKGGKFIEAALKALAVSAGLTFPTGKGFKADTVINSLGGLPAGSADNTVRLTIPRACRFIYEIASNRGGRHDPDEIDPNEMDANVVAMNCSWILAEMIRHAQHGAVNTDDAKNIVDSLVKRKYPLIENVDGRMYFHLENASAHDIALVALAHCYPSRMAANDLVNLLKRHDFTEKNARVTLKRVKKFVDEDGHGGLRLLTPGLKKAEEIMSSKSGEA